MKETEEIERDIREFAEPIEPNPDLTLKAKRLAQELYGGNGTKPKKKNFWKIFSVVATACACVLVAILVPTLTRSPSIPPVNRYSDEKMESDIIENIEAFITSNNYTCKYFADAQQSYVNRVIETSQPVIIEQRYTFLDIENESLDSIFLNICLTQDEFERFEGYGELVEQKQVNAITVQYSIVQTGNRNTIMAKCEVESYRYYWNITTLQGADRIDFYINYLFRES